MTGSQGLGHAVLVVPDIEQAVEFFTGVLGLKTSDITRVGGPFGEMWFLRAANPRHHSLGLMGMAGMSGLQHVMIETKNMDAVGMAYDAAHKAGLPIASSMGRHIGDRMLSFYARTPTGFDFEIGWDSIQVDDEQLVRSVLRQRRGLGRRGLGSRVRPPRYQPHRPPRRHTGLVTSVIDTHAHLFFETLLGSVGDLGPSLTRDAAGIATLTTGGFDYTTREDPGIGPQRQAAARRDERSRHRGAGGQRVPALVLLPYARQGRRPLR